MVKIGYKAYLTKKRILYTIRKSLDANIIKDLEKEAYYALTKDEALSKNIMFGFAIKYRIIQQDIDKTLFRINTYNVYKLLLDLDKVKRMYPSPKDNKK